MNEVFLLTGGNLGNRQENLARAKSLVEKNCGTVLRCSALYETAPWGKPDQPYFLNQVLHLHTGLSPTELLKALLVIETEMGRVRGLKNDARIIDIDILYYGQGVYQTEELEIPHPRIRERKFVLIPLHELSPDFIDPKHQLSIQEMLHTCTDTLEVTTFGDV